ncbi:hypothetical protein AB0D88_16795 [Streptomyces werraensis]|uniref:hypothetical protein n=1 Tax=Streptomyces werraensis TaxID=68284 RepID=UPI00341315FA
MSRQPVPLPAEHIPPGTPQWRTADVRRWLDAVPARWAHPLFAFLALAVSVAWEVTAAPVPACTSAEPCGSDWPGLAVAVVLVLSLYWVWRQPRLAIGGLAVTVVAVAAEDGVSAFARPSALAYLLAAGFAVAGLVHRLAVAGRQRALALEAAGSAAQPLPEAARTFRRGRLSFVLAAVFLAVAGFGVWQALGVADAYEQRAARAAHLSGEVTAVDEGEGVLTVTAEGRTRRVETAFPEDFPVGTRVDLVADGGGALLVAEPYDAFGWELLVLGGSVVGLAFLANGVTGHLAARRLRREPLPVLHVLVREGEEDGRTYVFAADDTEGRRPVLCFHSLYAFEDDEEEFDEEEFEREEFDGDDPASGDDADLRKIAEILRGGGPTPPLREAVLYGAPYAGAEVAFAAREDEDDPEVAVECSVTAVKPTLPEWRGRGPQRRERTSPRRSADEIAARMTPTAGPRVWRAHGFSRAIGLGLLLVQGGGVWAALDDGPSWTWLWLVPALPWLLTSVATALTWRITADRDGLWMTGAWRVRRVPWDVITSVRHHEDGIRVGRAKDSSVDLSPTGWAWLERRTGREPGAERVADEVRALLHRPDLRPDAEATSGQQGMPVGPPLVALTVLWGAAVLLLL